MIGGPDFLPQQIPERIGVEVWVKAVSKLLYARGNETVDRSYMREWFGQGPQITGSNSLDWHFILHVAQGLIHWDRRF